MKKRLLSGMKIDLSIVIVNYNVKHYLEQCIRSIYAAAKNIQIEIFVVDNQSSDFSVPYLKEIFPTIHFIENKENVGFSKANNQAISLCQGDFVLILNPDTVVAEDSFEQCIQFMKKTADAGAIGVRMIDGKGNFLPESKRGLPTPKVAFYKIFGLSYLFPNSKKFGQYHLGFLNENENHAVDVLSGAFMFFKKEVLDQIGGFDEAFFMYGEDIDLSYRVQKAGFKNYYLAETTIIHYKGESTKKGSLNYVKVFFQAMLIFVKKHFASSQTRLFNLLIHFAVIAKAIFTFLSNLLASSFLYIIDAFLIYLSVYIIAHLYAKNVMDTPEYYPTVFFTFVVPIYIFIWLFSTFINAGYEKPFRLSPLFKGIFLGTLIIAALYGFLPNTWRYSRAIIIFSSISSLLVMIATRVFYFIVNNQRISFETVQESAVAFIGSDNELDRLKNNFKHLLFPNQTVMLFYSTEKIKEKLAFLHIHQVIFSAKDLSYKEIIHTIQSAGNVLEYKIFNPSANFLIGSNSKNTAGDILSIESNLQLLKPVYQQQKRLMDILICFIVILITPLIFIFQKSGKSKYLFAVLSGRKTWIGFMQTREKPSFYNCIPPFVFPLQTLPKNIFLDDEKLNYLNYEYARNYSAWKDLKLFFTHLFSDIAD